MGPERLLSRWRVGLLRLCGFRIGKDVYIADDLLIVEELAERGNMTIGDRVSIAPRVTLVTSSHPNHSRIRRLRAGLAGAHHHRARCLARSRLRHPARCAHRPRSRRGGQQCRGERCTSLHVVAGQPARTVRELTPEAGWQ